MSGSPFNFVDSIWVGNEGGLAHYGVQSWALAYCLGCYIMGQTVISVMGLSLQLLGLL